MEPNRELALERAYMERVRQRLFDLIEQSRQQSIGHEESIRAIMSDTWDELRRKPTALSPEDLQQLSAEVHRVTARQRFVNDYAERSCRMLLNPYFARIDFRAEGEAEADRFVIGLYNLPDEKGDILVCDWRAPVCSLYYSALPGPASYMSPGGEVAGTLELKRRYRIVDGELRYYVDTRQNIDDSALLDILSGSASSRMRQIVSTIQAEQNAAIRSEEKRLVAVVGSAGSGKTSVAMHRAAYLMYQRRDQLDASRIQILSPGSAFSEYISTVLPELGEENIRSRTMQSIVEEILGTRVESPAQQSDQLLSRPSELRRLSVSWKSGADMLRRLRAFAERIEQSGPQFGDVVAGGECLMRGEELRSMYGRELTLLTPAQKLTRMLGTLETRLSDREERLYCRYEKMYGGKYKGRELAMVCRTAVAQDMQPIRSALRHTLAPKPEEMLERVYEDAPEELRQAFLENRQAGILWWEDALAEAWLLVRLGFVRGDGQIYHLLVDEAQDLSDTALSLLHVYHQNARVTLLGDPMQRTCPAMPPCVPEEWSACFEAEDAPVYHLSRAYRSTLPIARLCNAILPGGERLDPFGREGEMPRVEVYSESALKSALNGLREDGFRSIAILTRTQEQAEALSGLLENVYRLDGGELDADYERNDNIVACFQLVKGLEFDAVIAVWPDCELTDGERRRIYTACSRALHRVVLLAEEPLVRALGIVL